jgi:uncharacterized protein YndB with AHSA1/START domain
MAVTEIDLAVGPGRVFEVLSDPNAYADWVVGSDTIRDADPSWPAAGSRFHHRVGVGPVKVNDDTEVIELDPARKLVLHARARPLGTAVVSMEWVAQGAGTHVTMRETAGDSLSRLAINPLTDWTIHRRNRLALRRFKRIAEAGVGQGLGQG